LKPSSTSSRPRALQLELLEVGGAPGYRGKQHPERGDVARAIGLWLIIHNVDTAAYDREAAAASAGRGDWDAVKNRLYMSKALIEPLQELQERLTKADDRSQFDIPGGLFKYDVVAGVMYATQLRNAIRKAASGAAAWCIVPRVGGNKDEAAASASSSSGKSSCAA